MSKSYFVFNTTTQNSGILCQATSTNLLLIVPNAGVTSFYPATQSGNTLLVYRAVESAPDSGQILNIVQH